MDTLLLFVIIFVAFCYLLVRADKKDQEHKAERAYRQIFGKKPKRMSHEEAMFAEQAYHISNRGLDARTSKTAKKALDEYEVLHAEISSRRDLVSEHIYQEDMRDIRDNYTDLAIEEWHEKAGKILDQFIRTYIMITEHDFKEVDKAYRSKNRCIGYWTKYFDSIPHDTGLRYDPKGFMKSYLGEDYDPCMEYRVDLEKKLNQCLEEMRPEYKRKLRLRDQVLNTVAEQGSIMRSELIKTPFEGCTPKETEYMIKELVEKRRLAAVKIGNRYFISLSEGEKNNRAK